MNEKPEPYLQYLDKEMGIMGILSTFCIAVPSLILERLLTAKENELARIWTNGEVYFWIASVLMFFAASLFYKQRSLLAFYYGRISMGKPPEIDKDRMGNTLVDWKDWADMWTTWIPYNVAFWVAGAATVEYSLGFVSYYYLMTQCRTLNWQVWPPVGLVVIVAVMIFIMKDRPIRWDGNHWVGGVRELRKKKRKVKG